MPIDELERPIRPMLVIFENSRSGFSRRAESCLAQVLQRRKNHEVFNVLRIEMEQRPDLVERFRVHTDPTLLVIENRRVQRRLTRPRSAPEIQRAFSPWLR